MEYLLTALSGCLTTSLAASAAARGIQLDGVTSELEGDLDVRGLLGLDESVRNGYQDIRLKFKIKSPEPDEKIAELVELAQQRSPVYGMVTNRVTVTVDWEK